MDISTVIITALITLCASMAGMWLQSHLAAKKDMNNFLREKKFEVYENALIIIRKQVEDLLHNLESETYLQGFPSHESDEHEKRFEDLFQAFAYKHALLTSMKIRREFNAFSNKMISTCNNPPQSKLQLLELKEELDKKYNRLCDLMRKDLRTL